MNVENVFFDEIFIFWIDLSEEIIGEGEVFEIRNFVYDFWYGFKEFIFG